MPIEIRRLSHALGAAVTGVDPSRPIDRRAWHVEDMLMRDNRCAMHLAQADGSHDQPWHMHRLTVLGTPCGRLLEPEAV
jgi:alpha-ketoglutarate-dependent taurine dioxygenase